MPTFLQIHLIHSGHRINVSCTDIRNQTIEIEIYNIRLAEASLEVGQYQVVEDRT